MSDEELDSVFRRVANEYSPEGPPPGAWERLEGQLTTAATTQQLRGKVLRAFGVEVAVLGLLVWQSAQLLPHLSQDNRLVSNNSAVKTTRQVVVGAKTNPAVPAAAVIATSEVAASPAAASGRSAAQEAAPGATVTKTTLTPASPATAQLDDLASTAPAAAVAPVPATLAAERARHGRRGAAAHAAVVLASPASAVAAPGKGSGVRPKALLDKGAGPASAAASTTAVAGSSLPTAATVIASSALVEAAATGVARHKQPATHAARPPMQLAAAPGERTRRLRAKAGLLAGNKLNDNTKAADSQAAATEDLPVARLAEAPANSREVRLPLGAYPLPDSLGGLARLLPADTAKEQKPPVPRPPYRLVLGLLGAPSFSAVRTPQTARLGGDYGLTLEYLLTARLRVRAGLISSRKRYQAASSDYEAPAAWQWFPGNYQLDADCRITEIPLDVRFDVLRRPTYTLFTSLGVNSLLMRNEQYSYDWTMGGQTFTKSAQVVNGSNHFLGVLNLSVGVERPIGGRWSAQVEPFWQIPLGGVGAGKVHLSSAGAAFSLKFGLIR